MTEVKLDNIEFEDFLIAGCEDSDSVTWQGCKWIRIALKIKFNVSLSIEEQKDFNDAIGYAIKSATKQMTFS